MTAKRIVLIILCVLMLVMVVLFAVVGSKFAPLLSLLTGGAGQQKPVGTTTAPGILTPSTTVTTPSDTDLTTAPTMEPTIPTVAEPTEPHEHVYSVSKVVKASCGTPGYTIYACKCGKTDIRDYQEAKSHVFGDGTEVEATCETRGYTEYICKSCGYVDTRNYVDPIGHDYELVETVEATCVQDGYDLYKCKNCDGEKKENEIIAPGHTCGEWTETTPPGPGQSGEDSAVCTVCGETVTRPCELEIRGIQKTKYDSYHSYTVCVGTRTTNQAITYTIIDYSCSEKLGFYYREEGLVVNYDSKELTTLLALQDLTLTIDENGNIVAGDSAQPSEPTEPLDPTDPSEPSDPSVPSDPSEPTGVATEE